MVLAAVCGKGLLKVVDLELKAVLVGFWNQDERSGKNKKSREGKLVACGHGERRTETISPLDAARMGTQNWE